MSVAESPPPVQRQGSFLVPYKFGVDQFLQAADTGVFLPEDRIELIEGQVLQMNPLGDAHEVATHLVAEVLSDLLPEGWHVRIQASIRLSASLPIPDVAVVRGTIRDYSRRKPQPKDVGLLVEVSDTTLAYDRNVKGPLYASAGIAEYRIVNLNDQQVEIYRQPQPAQGPSPATYAPPQIVDAKGTLTFQLDGHTIGPIKVADLLP